jgi:hypothetical protein
MNSVIRALLAGKYDEHNLAAIDLAESDPRVLTGPEKDILKYFRECLLTSGELPSADLFLQRFPDFDFDVQHSVDLCGKDIRIHLANVLQDRRKRVICTDLLKVSSKVGVEGFTDEVFAEIQQIYQEYPANGQTNYTVYTAEDVFATCEPIQFAVDHLITQGGVTVLAGEAGVGKTYLTLDLITHIASGQPWLGRGVRLAKCLIVDQESGKQRLQMRLREVMQAHGCNASLPLCWMSMSGFDLTNEQSANRLIQTAKDGEFGFLLFDSLTATTPGGTDSDPKFITPAMLTLRRISVETGATLVVIHHFNKQAAYRGSTTIRDQCDLLLNVTRNADGIITIKTDKARDVTPQSLSFRLQVEENKQADLLPAECHTAVPGAATDTFNSSEFIWQYLVTHGRATAAQIEAAATAAGHQLAESTAQKKLRSLALQQPPRVVNVSGSSGGRGKSAVYELLGNSAELDGSADINLDAILLPDGLTVEIP